MGSTIDLAHEGQDHFGLTGKIVSTTKKSTSLMKKNENRI